MEIDVNSKSPLNWEVFVTPGIPVATSDVPPGQKQRTYSPISSTLIYGKRDAVLVDTFLTIKQSDDLVKWVAASGKNLTTIYITHGHGDHWFGIGALLSHFPNARAVATPDVVKSMRQLSSPEFIRNWNLGYLIEVKNVLSCLLNDPWVVIRSRSFVPGYYHPWVERLDLVECRDPLLAFLRSWRCSQKHVSAIEGCISYDS